VVAEFLSEGHFARHIRRMRTLYAERQRALVSAARRHFAGLLELSPADAGMHLVAWLPDGANDREASRRAAAAGVSAPALSRYSVRAAQRPALLLGYASLNQQTIDEGAERLAGAMINWLQRVGGLPQRPRPGAKMPRGNESRL
jgi:GntR family transcriptional regulator/MocR family aminotransferase